MRTLCVLISLALASSFLAFGQRENVIYNFRNASDGAVPNANVISDAAGNLYGTTAGNYENSVPTYGSVFELMPAVGGTGWTEVTLYTFSGGIDGGDPRGSMALDRAGNLYSTTNGGGAYGSGTVFQLTPPNAPGGPWTETVLYSFTGGADGQYPEAGPILDPEGNLYGTTAFGGTYGDGVVFKLHAPAQPGAPYTEKVLYSFTAFSAGKQDGFWPQSGLVFDKQGDLYGTTDWGGTPNLFCGDGCGIVFQLVPPTAKDEPWTENILQSFDGINNGSLLYATLIIDGRGSLFGAAFDGSGQAYGGGVIFQLSPPISGGPWTETILHRFPTDVNNAPGYPAGGVVFDRQGNLYGTTTVGSAKELGTVYKLTKPATQGGEWPLTVLHAFQGGNDGEYPYDSLIFGKDGLLYGTAEYGGTGQSCLFGENYIGCGVVFSVMP